jgi:hypothetical protein
MFGSDPICLLIDAWRAHSNVNPLGCLQELWQNALKEAICNSQLTSFFALLEKAHAKFEVGSMCVPADAFLRLQCGPW